MRKFIIGLFVIVSLCFGEISNDVICKDGIEIHKDIVAKVEEAQKNYIERVKNKLIPHFISDLIMDWDIKEALKYKELAKTKTKACGIDSDKLISQWEYYYISAENIVEDSKSFRESLK